MRENRTHGSEGGDGESRLRPLSEASFRFGPQIVPVPVFSEEDTKITKNTKVYESQYSELRALRVLRGEFNLSSFDYDGITTRLYSYLILIPCFSFSATTFQP